MGNNIPGSNQMKEDDFSRRDFLKFCSMVAAAIGLGPAMGSKVAAALTSTNRPRVLWLHFAECTGCTESLLRSMPLAVDASQPYFDDLIFNTLSLDYHETLMAAAGSTVHDALSAEAEANRGNFICVVEGAIPTKDNGVYGTINGKTMLSIAQEICPKAKLCIAIGNCAAFGGIPNAAPNPTEAYGLIYALKNTTLGDAGGIPIINVAGCPPNPISFVGVIAHYLLFGSMPSVDEFLRPLFAYETTVHKRCPNLEDDPDKNPNSKCLKYKGCKGPSTANICPTVRFNNYANFPVGANHVCIGCSEAKFWDVYTPFYTLDARDVPLDEAPTPSQIFGKDVGVLQPFRKSPSGQHIRETNPGVFNALGRRIQSTQMKKTKGLKKQPMGRGMLFEKTKNGARKTLGI